ARLDPSLLRRLSRSGLAHGKRPAPRHARRRGGRRLLAPPQGGAGPRTDLGRGLLQRRHGVHPFGTGPEGRRLRGSQRDALLRAPRTVGAGHRAPDHPAREGAREVITRRDFMITGGAALAAIATQDPKKTYRACVIGDTKRGGYGHGLDTCFQKIPNVTVLAV